MTADLPAASFPPPLDSYPVVDGGVWQTIVARIDAEPLNAVATGVFVLAILHTFSASWFAARAHRIQHEHEVALRRTGLPPTPSFRAEVLHFLGEVEVVFGLWAVVLLGVLAAMRGWDVATHYVNDRVVYTEALFVVVIMALASTRPIVGLAEAVLRRLASVGRGTPAAWWFTILVVGPLLGSFITEPGAMTISALLLQRQFFDLEPGTSLKYATLGLLFVNVSIGGTLTHFAAPPVLMVARLWEWDMPYMLGHFGWRSMVGIVISTALYFVVFRAEFRRLATRPPVADRELPDEDASPLATEPLAVPGWVTAVHVLFMAWTVFNAHYPALFLGGFLFFLGFTRATAPYQSRLELRTPLLVGFFLGGLVIHGGLQGWWIAPVLSSLGETPLFLGAGIMTAFNDNALITYLSTLVPNLSESMRVAVVEGAVVGGGLTVIANAPNPAGQALLARFFGGSVSPIGLLAGAFVPTIIAGMAFRFL
jgi:hypothetical protein